MEQQSIYLENRERMTINQVIDVDAFDEETLWANLKEGAVEISGSGLHIEKLDLAEGVLIVSGIICAFAYVEPKKQKAGKRLRTLRAKFRNERADSKPADDFGRHGQRGGGRGAGL